MRYYIKLIDRFDGRECFHVLKATSKEDARNKYLSYYPLADICGVEEIPDGCITVGELKKILDDFPYCMPVYINSNGEHIATYVNKTLALGKFECIEIS